MFGNSPPAFAMSQLPASDFGPQISLPEPTKKKGGMFGSGLGIGEALILGLNGYLAGRGNPIGMANLQMFQRRRDDEAARQQAAQDRENNFQDFVRREAWQLANKPQNDDGFTALMRQAGIDPASPEGRAAYQQAFQNRVNPFVAMNIQNPDGSETRQFIRPPMMGFGQPQIGSVVDDPRQGGPMPQASGGFPF